jgi:hypothetical protein
MLLLYVLSLFISNCRSPLKFDFLLAAALIAPLFQTSGFNRFMGIIDQSAIYTSFYALQMALFLVFVIPFYNSLYRASRKDLNDGQLAIMLCLSLVLALGGPLTPGLVLILVLLIISSLVRQAVVEKVSIGQAIHLHHLGTRKMIVLVWICLLSCYSLYLGTYNDLNSVNTISIWERYARIPIGLFILITTKIGLPLLLLTIAANIYIIGRYFRYEEGVKIVQVVKWLGIFSICYVLLLPLGGYRIYRPDIVRYDTFLPVSLALIFIFGFTTHFL